MTKSEADNLQQQCIMLNEHIQPFKVECDVREWGYTEGEHIWEVCLKFSRRQAEANHFTDVQMARGFIHGMQYAFSEVKMFNWTKGALSMTKKIGSPVQEQEDEPQFGQCGKCGDWVTFPCYNCQAMMLEGK